MIRDLIAPNVGNTSFPKAIRKIDISNIPYFTNIDNWDDFYAIKAVGNEVVMVSSTNNFVYYSNDGGVTFAKTPCPSFDPTYSSISYINGSFFVFAYFPNYASITNGVVSLGTITGGAWRSIAYFSGNYYIVGNSGTIGVLGIGSSLDNLTYSQPFGTAIMYTISVIDGILYAAGASGVLYRSYNGSDWELLATGLTASISDMAFSTQDSLFLLATGSGLYYSSDLITFTLSTVTASIRTVTVSPVNPSKIIVSNGQETTSGIAGTWSSAKASITRCTYSTDGTIYGSGINGYFYKDTAGSVLNSAYYQTASYRELVAVGYFKSTNKLMVVLTNLIVMCTVLDDNTVSVDNMRSFTSNIDFTEVYELNGAMVVVYGYVNDRYSVESQHYINGGYDSLMTYSSSVNDTIRSVQKINPNQLLIGSIDKYVALLTMPASGAAVPTSIGIAPAVGSTDDILGVGIGHDGQTYIAKDDDNFVIKGVGNLNTSLGATADLSMKTTPDLDKSEMVKIVSTSTKTAMAYQSAQPGELRFWLSTNNGSTWTEGSRYGCYYSYSSIFKLADDIYFVTQDVDNLPLLAKLVGTELVPHYRLRDEIPTSFTIKPYIGDNYVVFYAANTYLGSSINRYIYIME